MWRYKRGQRPSSCPQGACKYSSCPCPVRSAEGCRAVQGGAGQGVHMPKLYFVVPWASLLFDSRFRCSGNLAFSDVHPASPISTFLHTLFSHFHHIYSFSRLIDMVIHFEGACYGTTYFPPHFSGPLSPWISVLGIGCSTLAPTACDLLPRWLGRLKTDSSTWNTTRMGGEC